MRYCHVRGTADKTVQIGETREKVNKSGSTWMDTFESNSLWLSISKIKYLGRKFNESKETLVNEASISELLALRVERFR